MQRKAQGGADIIRAALLKIAPQMGQILSRQSRGGVEPRVGHVVAGHDSKRDVTGTASRGDFVDAVWHKSEPTNYCLDNHVSSLGRSSSASAVTQGVPQVQSFVQKAKGALPGLSAGKAQRMAQTKAIGCGIKFRAKTAS